MPNGMRIKRVILWAMLVLVVLTGITYALRRLLSGPPLLASGRLADGRILQVEGLTFGTNHHIGRHSFAERFAPWLPPAVVRFFEPRYPYSQFTLDEPGLVVWVNAIDPVTGKHVDCQGIRMEFIDEHGDLFGQDTASWFGGNAFWRVGHVFHSFPRAQPKLTLQIACWRMPSPALRVELPNPCLARPATWLALPVPQRLDVGDLQVEFTELRLRTNGGPKQIWETPCRYWEPVWQLRRNGAQVSGWDEPQWSAADPAGNSGKFLGTHQPVLRFSAEFYPCATNLTDSLLVGRLAEVDLTKLPTNAWRDVALATGSTQLMVLGLCAPGIYVFREGRFETNPAVRMSATRGGAPSGWVGQSQRISPMQVRHWHGHYTPVPVVYICAPALADKERLGLRLRDEQGRYWLAKAEPEGPEEGIWPFLVELPPEVRSISGEVVLLKPVRAEFTVQTTAAAP
ncbi:exported hypothetical protein [Verrucomicrobia bacterium]|nr:exported hypothetical protein [Verrucomicrobiota bacterium]